MIAKKLYCLNNPAKGYTNRHLVKHTDTYRRNYAFTISQGK